MLDDPRADALTRNFACQWLYLRDLEYRRPDVVQFPVFNTQLPAAMPRWTELYFGSVVRENRSVLRGPSATTRLGPAVWRALDQLVARQTAQATQIASDAKR